MAMRHACLCLVVLGTLVGNASGQTAPAATPTPVVEDGAADVVKAMVVAFRKFDASLEVGVSYVEYHQAARKLYVDFKLFRESAEGGRDPVVTASLGRALEVYMVVDRLWYQSKFGGDETQYATGLKLARSRQALWSKAGLNVVAANILIDGTPDDVAKVLGDMKNNPERFATQVLVDDAQATVDKDWEAMGSHAAVVAQSGGGSVARPVRQDADRDADPEPAPANVRSLEYRSNGKMLKADFVSFKGGVAKLLRDDGRFVSVAISRFAEADQKWLLQQQRNDKNKARDAR